MKMISNLLILALRLFFKILFLFVKERRSPDALKKAINLYKTGDFGELFAKIRAWDSPYEEINKLIPRKGRIVDLGSGDGLLANYLAIYSDKRFVYGIELRKKRAEASFKGLVNTKFKRGDVTKENYGKADCIIMFHLLHHISPAMNQEKLIKKVSKSLSKGSKLVVVEITQRPLSKYAFCYLVDAFILPILFDKKLYDFDFHYRNVGDWKNLFMKGGFKTEVKLVDKGMPFGHVIFTCTRI